MINEFSQMYQGNFDQLTMKLNGTVDPAVAGGFVNYERAFLTDTYAKHATHAQLQQIEQLKDLMAQQMPILEQLLVIHDGLIRQDPTKADLAPLHDNMTRKFHQLKAEVEEKYGRRMRQTRLQRHASSIARRQSKKAAQESKNRTSQETSSSGSRPNSALQDVPDVPIKVKRLQFHMTRAYPALMSLSSIDGT